MSNIGKALLWAAVMMGSAIFMRTLGMSDNASLGVIAGLTGAAWGSLNSEMGCGRSCLQ